jgi:hypothetical protein
MAPSPAFGGKFVESLSKARKADEGQKANGSLTSEYEVQGF